MYDRIIKKIISLALAGLWMFSPCASLADTAQHTVVSKQHPQARKTAKYTHHKNKHESSIHHKKNKHKKNSIQHAKSKPKQMTHKTSIPNDRTALVKANAAPIPMPAPEVSRGLFASIGQRLGQRLVSFVHKTVNTLRYSAYKWGGTKFDTSHGIYIVDCSDYIDHVLKAVYPDAYFDLVNTSGATKPTTQHYYDFFSTLTNDPNDYWNKINDVEHLQPGDILVFRYKNSLGLARGGHVMVVMDKPIRAEDDAFLVRVADSAPAGHSQDTRPGHASGIGIGTLLLKTNPKTGQPSAFAWKVGARWESNVNIAMARPINV